MASGSQGLTAAGVVAAHLRLAQLALLLLLVLAAFRPVQALGFEVLDAGETVAMHALRDALHRSAAPWVIPIPGWSRHNPSPHCMWSGVKCEQRTRPDGVPEPTRRVTQIRLWSPQRLTSAQRLAAANRKPPYPDGKLGPRVPLLPELASKLPYLEHLAIGQFYAPFGGLPAEWLAAGGFPRLKTLELAGIALGSALPEVAPGRLPALERLRLEFDAEVGTVLPRSWGSSPEVLPSLQALQVAMPPVAQLPADWGRGFWQLRQLRLLSPACGQRLAAAVTAPTPGPLGGGGAVAGGGAAEARATAGPDPGVDPPSALAATADGPASAGLPAAWASGFPALQELALCGLGLGGALPGAWLQRSAFPLLTILNLADNRLSGSLPHQLFDAHKLLAVADLGRNAFTGALPDAWAAAKVQTLWLTNNSLSGPAFPPAWLARGALPALAELSLSGNPGLGGELPPELPWLSISSLQLAGTGVHGVIPQGWCLGPLKLSLRRLGIRGTAVVPTLPECVSRGVGRLYLDVPAEAASSTGDSSGSGASSPPYARLPGDALPAGGVVLGSLPPGALARSRQEAQAGSAGSGFAILVGVAAALAASAVLAASVAGRALWARHQRRLRSRHDAIGRGSKGGGQRGVVGPGDGDEEEARHLLHAAAEPSSSVAPNGAMRAPAQLAGEQDQQPGMDAAAHSVGEAAGAAGEGTAAAGDEGGSIELAPWGAVGRDVTRSRESLLRRQQEEQQRQELEASLLRQWQQMQDAQASHHQQQGCAQQQPQPQQQQQESSQPQQPQQQAEAAQSELQAPVAPEGQADLGASDQQERLHLEAVERQTHQGLQQVQQQQVQQQHLQAQPEAAKQQQDQQLPGAAHRRQAVQERAQSQLPTPQRSENAAQLQHSWQKQQHAPPAPSLPLPPQQQEQRLMQVLQAQPVGVMQQPHRLPAEHQLLLRATQQKLVLLAQHGRHLPAAQQQQLLAIQQQLGVLAQRQQQRQLASVQQPSDQQHLEQWATAPAPSSLAVRAAGLPAGGVKPAVSAGTNAWPANSFAAAVAASAAAAAAPSIDQQAEDWDSEGSFLDYGEYDDDDDEEEEEEEGVVSPLEASLRNDSGCDDGKEEEEEEEGGQEELRSNAPVAELAGVAAEASADASPVRAGAENLDGAQDAPACLFAHSQAGF